MDISLAPLTPKLLIVASMMKFYVTGEGGLADLNMDPQGRGSLADLSMDLQGNNKIFSMSKRTLMNYYSSASGSGSGSTPHTNESTSQPKKLREEFSHSNLIADPTQRKPIDSYDPAIRDQLKRAYALSGPTQPHEFKFPSKWMVDQWRTFQKSWFDEFDWLEYSYINWKNANDTFQKHSASKNHTEARLKCDDFMNQRTSVGRRIVEMISPDIQKDLAKACAEEVTAVSMDEIRGRKFSVLIDESRDVSIKEQMAVILRFVNNKGQVVERFLGLQHVQSCTAIALKEALVDMLSSHNLSISMLHGQGYDGASNMRGEFNGVQKLICDENPYAFYVHCFAHQLQLVVVAVSTSSADIADFFNYVPLIVSNDMRENGWEPLLKRVITFYEKNEIEVPDMDKEINVRGTPRRRKQNVTNMHYYHVELFLVAIDALLTEMNHRFSETSSELLICMAAFNPRDSSNFDVKKLVRLAEIYADDFDIGELAVLPNHLTQFVNRARRTLDFLGCTELGKVAEIMVKIKMHTSYKLVYRLIELILILPMATASVERIFSALTL
ncbi:unnamed protein product [Miscanthus lutarioriparius]|uniref:DUF4371 domain-containing protein n=1 Tax=Miscanthus lutarioriparius TaxID=422564 RepID=A0A811S3E3_9POAL|nr:unnamed protein product [Miscanthus lutarioriparius]